MVNQIEFKKDAVMKAEQDFSKLQLPPENRKNVTSFAQLYTQFLPISELAMKGFISMAMRDFQVQEKMDIMKIYQLPRETQDKWIQKMTAILQDKLEKVLLHPEQKAALRDAIKNAQDFAHKMV